MVPSPAAGGVVSVSSSDPSIFYTGDWSQDPTLACSNHNRTLIPTSRSATINLAFNGSSVQLLGNHFGDVTMLFDLDGFAQANATFPNPPPSDRSTNCQTYYAAFDLEPGPHTLSVSFPFAPSDTAGFNFDHYTFMPLKENIAKDHGNGNQGQSVHKLLPAIVGGAVGGFILILIIVLIVWRVRRSGRRKMQTAQPFRLQPGAVLDPTPVSYSIPVPATTVPTQPVTRPSAPPLEPSTVPPTNQSTTSLTRLLPDERPGTSESTSAPLNPFADSNIPPAPRNIPFHLPVRVHAAVEARQAMTSVVVRDQKVPRTTTGTEPARDGLDRSIRPSLMPSPAPPPPYSSPPPLDRTPPRPPRLLIPETTPFAVPISGVSPARLETTTTLTSTTSSIPRFVMPPPTDPFMDGASTPPPISDDDVDRIAARLAHFMNHGQPFGRNPSNLSTAVVRNASATPSVGRVSPPNIVAPPNAVLRSASSSAQTRTVRGNEPSRTVARQRTPPQAPSVNGSSASNWL